MYDLLSLRPQITRVIIKREKKIVVTTNRAVYIIAFDWIVFAQNLDDSFEFQCSLVRCCARTPLIRKSCFLTTATGFNALQNIPVINARFWHVLASTTFVNESFKYSEIRTNSDVVGGTLQKKFFQPFHEVSKIRAILHFDNNNRVATGHLIGSPMNNELELNGKQSTGPCSDWIKWQLETRDERQWMAFPRKYIEENGANNTAQHYGTTTKRELWKFYWKIKHSLNMRTIARLHAIAWALTKYLCQFFLFGVRPIQTITFNSGFMYVLSYKNS